MSTFTIKVNVCRTALGVHSSHQHLQKCPGCPRSRLKSTSAELPWVFTIQANVCRTALGVHDSSQHLQNCPGCSRFKPTSAELPWVFTIQANICRTALGVHDSSQHLQNCPCSFLLLLCQLLSCDNINNRNRTHTS